MIKTGIAGIGGIGSNVAQILVRSGLGYLKIIDFDNVEQSNLNRQFYFADQVGYLKTDMLKENLKKINPKIIIKKRNIKINRNNIESIFSDCDLIVEGLDKKEDKKMLFENFVKLNKPVVSASGIAGDNIKSISTRKMGNNYITGDFISDDDVVELFPAKVIMVASIMSSIVLKLNMTS